MAPPPLLYLFFQHHRRVPATGFLNLFRRPVYSSSAFASTLSEEPTSEKFKVKEPEPPKLFSKVDDADDRKWRAKEKEILMDIEPIACIVRNIIHSDRYKNGELLKDEDEKVVVERLLAYHPHSEDKIGCGLESIMVDRHPEHKRSRCLFVVRTDGGWEDFSFHKCLRQYIRNKYSSHAEKFIHKHRRNFRILFKGRPDSPTSKP